MTHLLALLRRLRALPTSLTALVAVLGIAGLVSAGSAGAHGSHGGRAVSPPPPNPTSADQIQNLDQVRTAIKAYYGDTTTPPPGAPTVSPTDGTTTLHYSSAGSAYDTEMGKIAGYASAYLKYQGHSNGHHHSYGNKAIVLDVDDTTLNTYNYEILSNFVYTPAQNGAFVNAAAFPAVFHMVRLVNQAKAEGYTVFFLTGRPESQRASTDTNLTKVGYPVADSQVYLKDLSAPWLASCAATPCTTIQYKSLTRQHIESLGYDIVGNFGDQYSDLSGGHANKTFKLPNPMYYLP